MSNVPGIIPANCPNSIPGAITTATALRHRECMDEANVRSAKHHTASGTTYFSA